MTDRSMPAARPPSVRAAVLGQAPLLRWALGFGLVTSLLVLVPTLFMLEVYDRVLNSRSLVTLAMLLLMALWAYLVMEGLELARGGVLARVAEAADTALRSRLFDAAMAGTLERGQRAGGAQMFQDLRTVREFIASPTVGAAMDLPATLVFLALLFLISPLLGAGALVGMLVQSLIAWHTERAIMPALQAANRAAQEAQVQAAQALRGAATAQALGMRAGLRRRWLGLQHRMLLQQALASDRNGLSGAASRMLLTLQGSLILGAACWLQLRGSFDGSGGLMIVASALGGRVLAPLAQLVGQWRSVVEARDAAARLDAALQGAPAPAATMPLPPPSGPLVVQQLLASPAGSTALVLKNLNFTVQPGEVVVCIGPSASGKSTLARVLVGVWPVRAGSVRLDGADVFAWNKDELGPHVGYLGQSVELFDGTLAENIARFGRVDRALVQAAAQRVGLQDWVQALPAGLETRIGDGGAFLSGGFRQRVALARALYGSPHLVVLDEPNASLDEPGDAALAAALLALKAAGAVVVVMSHRTSLLPVADRLLVLRDGVIAHDGPRDEVLAAMRKGAAPPASPVPAAPPAPTAPAAAVTASLPAPEASR